MDLNPIGLVTVATKNYIEYWKNMCTSAMSQKHSELIHFYVFTDNVKNVEEFSTQNGFENITAVEIPSFGWPEATLFRYKFISESRNIFKEPLLVHIDSDMKIVGDLVARLNERSYVGMTFVEHPGFVQAKSRKAELFKKSGIYLTMRDIKLKILEGGLGTWEKDKRSKAYVPKCKRRQYYCGGVWLGTRTEFLDFAKELGERTSQDLEGGVIARHNDESHLNWFACNFEHNSENSELCFDGTFPRMKNLSPVIVALDKGQEWIRIKT